MGIRMILSWLTDRLSETPGPLPRRGGEAERHMLKHHQIAADYLAGVPLKMIIANRKTGGELISKVVKKFGLPHRRPAQALARRRQIIRARDAEGCG